MTAPGPRHCSQRRATFISRRVDRVAQHLVKVSRRGSITWATPLERLSPLRARGNGRRASGVCTPAPETLMRTTTCVGPTATVNSPEGARHKLFSTVPRRLPGERWPSGATGQPRYRRCSSREATQSSTRVGRRHVLAGARSNAGATERQGWSKATSAASVLRFAASSAVGSSPARRCSSKASRYTRWAGDGSQFSSFPNRNGS